jgi:hypothetical protein
MTPHPASNAIPRVLLAEESLPYRRVIREALMAFRVCEIDDAPSGERAFELADLHREGGLRHGAKLGGVAEMPRAGERERIAQLAERQRIHVIVLSS